MTLNWDGSVLGPLEIRVGGAIVPIGARKLRLLTALLLARANEIVPAERLIDSLWDERPPLSARKNLQVYVSGLRRLIGDRVSYQDWGYRLRAGQDELDLLRFLRSAAAGRDARRKGETRAAANHLQEAIALWRGRPLAEFADVPMIEETVNGLTELYLSVSEDWVEIEVGRGRHVDALRLLDRLTPFLLSRERLVVAKMTALAGCGRAPEALSQFEAVRRYLATELGIGPSPVLRNVYDDILEGRDPGGRRAGRSLGRQLT